MNSIHNETEEKDGSYILKIVLVIFLVICGTIAAGIYWLTYDLNRFPKNALITEQSSANGEYTVKTYLLNSRTANSSCIIGELVINNSDEKTKNIYFNCPDDTASIEWLDDDTVTINGHTLNVPKDKFDYRRE